MKQLSLALLLATTSLFAATDEQIISYFKGQVPQNINISVTERTTLKDYNGFDMVKATLSDGSQSQVVNIFVKDGLMFPDIVDLKSGASMKQTLEQAEVEKALGELYKKEDPAHIIAIGNDKTKKTMVVFSDPECPYCRDELGNLESRLKEFNIKFILTSVHDKSALEKSHLIYKEAAKAKTDKAKIEVLRKYFDENAKVSESVSEEAVSVMHELRRKYLQGGLKGVPFIIEESALLR
ncbi:MAG: thioredoxin domain-containing protein [Campylobacteraceae bacterium]|nr:thioredoxin domain-containing protein [Campylobacteraceae bacterium]